MSEIKKASPIQIIVMTVGLVLLILLPQLAKNNYLISVGVTFCTYAALGTVWNIIGGYAGQISWCHASFLTIGAYSSYLLKIYFGISPWIGLLFGVAISLLAAFVIGSISFRLSGTFFSLVTISFSEIVRVLLLWKKDITKGANGLFITYHHDSWLELTFRSDKVFYYLMLGILIGCIVTVWKLEHSKIGYYLRVIKADQHAAETLGIETHKIKLKAFLISAAMSSAIGTIYAFFLTYIDPATVGAIDVSTKIGSMAIVGGLGTLFGPLIGAAVLIPITELANALLGSLGSGMLIYGLILIIIVAFRPAGLISFFSKSKDNPILSTDISETSGKALAGEKAEANELLSVNHTVKSKEEANDGG